MGLRDKKRNQRRVLSRRSAGPKTGEGKDFLVRAFPSNQIETNKEKNQSFWVSVADVLL
jgi:hypothetical protein